LRQDSLPAFQQDGLSAAAACAVRVRLTDGPELRSRARSRPRYKTVPWPLALGGSASVSPPEKPLGHGDQKCFFRPKIRLKTRGFRAPPDRWWRGGDSNSRPRAYEVLWSPDRGFVGWSQFLGLECPTAAENPLLTIPWSLLDASAEAMRSARLHPGAAIKPTIRLDRSHPDTDHLIAVRSDSNQGETSLKWVSPSRWRIRFLSCSLSRKQPRRKRYADRRT
jgi:hypothetical protein